MDFETATFKEIEENDMEIIRSVLHNIPKKDFEYDDDYAGWLLWGEKPLDEWFFEEGYCIINPKELLGFMEDIIENEIMVEL